MPHCKRKCPVSKPPPLPPHQRPDHPGQVNGPISASPTPTNLVSPTITASTGERMPKTVKMRPSLATIDQVHPVSPHPPFLRASLSCTGRPGCKLVDNG